MLKEWLLVFLMSRNAANDLTKRVGIARLVLILLLSLFVVSVPSNIENIGDYIHNFKLVVPALLGIYFVISILIWILSAFKLNIKYIMTRVVLTSSIIHIINGALVLLIYLLLKPMGLTQVALALTATLVSTYYVIVALSIVLPTEKFSQIKQIVVEVFSLVLWYIFMFYVLPLTK